jgi:thiol-disulfide isomerase/thioredoxin
MPSVFTVISDYLRPYQTAIIFFVAVIIFGSLAYYSYNNYYIPYKKRMEDSDVANNPQRKKIANIFFFFVDWCPHCKTAKPEWNSFKTQYNNTEVNGYTLKCYDINCTEDNGSIDIIDIPNNVQEEYNIQTTPTKIADLIRKYNIEAYPTIKMVKDNYTIDYDAKITSDSLEKFIQTVL